MADLTQQRELAEIIRQAAEKGRTALSLQYQSIGDEGAKAIAQLSGLTSLDLSHNSIGDEGARAIAQLAALTSLGLRDNHIGNEGAKAIAQLTGLTDIDLGNNFIHQDGARALALLPNLATLDLGNDLSNVDDGRIATFLGKEFVPPGNSIGDEGARAIAQLTALTSLGLRDNHIGDEGAKALLDSAQKNSSLRGLDLSDNPITFLPLEVLQQRDAQAILAAYRRYRSSVGGILNEAGGG
jgi:Leucine-rich repeat (LRR) protein